MALPPNYASPEDAKLAVHYVGLIEKAMWPGKISEQIAGEPAMAFFEALDPWMLDTMGGSVDATLLGSIGGVTLI